jgi:hypothetical protein
MDSQHGIKTGKNIVWMILGDKGRFTEEQAKAEAALIKGLKSVKRSAVRSIYCRI